MTRAKANTVMLDTPPKSRLRDKPWSKFNLDMTSRLAVGGSNYARFANAGGLRKRVAFEPNQTGIMAHQGTGHCLAATLCWRNFANLSDEAETRRRNGQ